LASNVSPDKLKTTEVQSGRRWGGPVVTNMLEGVKVNGGSIEFDIRLVEAEVPASRFDVDRKPRKALLAPSMIFGSNPGSKDYFVVNLPQLAGDRKVVTMNRATNGEANVDRNPGGGGLLMEKDKWYKVRVDLDNNNMVRVYLDGGKVFEQIASAPSGHYTVAGYDENTGETIIKVVNSTGEPYKASISINASKIEPKGKVITMQSDDKKAENTMENPTKIVPQVCEFDGFGKNFQYTFEPNSFTILRVKSTK